MIIKYPHPLLEIIPYGICHTILERSDKTVSPEFYEGLDESLRELADASGDVVLSYQITVKPKTNEEPIHILDIEIHLSENGTKFNYLSKKHSVTSEVKISNP